jgi:small subunit ribosomal protein S17
MTTKKAQDQVKEKTSPIASTSVSADKAILRNSLQKRRSIIGIVVSDKMQKTIVVQVDRQVRHVLYKKYVEKSNRYKAHDEKNDARIGDRVTLVESRPLSREKRWVLQSILRRAGQAPEANV